MWKSGRQACCSTFLWVRAEGIGGVLTSACRAATGFHVSNCIGDILNGAYRAVTVSRLSNCAGDVLTGACRAAAVFLLSKCTGGVLISACRSATVFQLSHRTCCHGLAAWLQPWCLQHSQWTTQGTDAPGGGRRAGCVLAAVRMAVWVAVLLADAAWLTDSVLGIRGAHGRLRIPKRRPRAGAWDTVVPGRAVQPRPIPDSVSRARAG